MNNSRLIKISKYLSYHLRHHPEKINIQLEPSGWVSIAEFLAACQADNFPITLSELKEVVESNDKQRFSFDPTGLLIRANQGHSIAIDLQLDPKVPPEFLYHGTEKGSVESILTKGICKMSRHHVHLSSDRETARKVGARRGIPVVFTIRATDLHNNGYPFYCSENGVWLVDSVPPEYLQLT